MYHQTMGRLLMVMGQPPPRLLSFDSQAGIYRWGGWWWVCGMPSLWKSSFFKPSTPHYSSLLSISLINNPPLRQCLRTAQNNGEAGGMGSGYGRQGWVGGLGRELL